VASCWERDVSGRTQSGRGCAFDDVGHRQAFGYAGDAHGKNFSFFVRREGLDPAPWYDLVSVLQYPGIDHELAMAWGDAFSLDDVGAFQLADFAQRCGVARDGGPAP
jgi:hypothetical protein